MSHAAPHLRTYFLVFLALMAGTALTVWVAFFDLGPFNNLVAMGIATIKATLVVLYFMHVKDSTRLTRVVIIGSLAFLVLLIGFVLADAATRGFLTLPGRELLAP